MANNIKIFRHATAKILNEFSDKIAALSENQQISAHEVVIEAVQHYADMAAKKTGGDLAKSEYHLQAGYISFENYRKRLVEAGLDNATAKEMVNDASEAGGSMTLTRPIQQYAR